MTIRLSTFQVNAWQAWSWGAGSLHRELLPFQPQAAFAPSQADLNGDGRPERLELSGGRAALWQGPDLVWQSPIDWQVDQAELADLNQDGFPELIMTVWRPFQPWPIDRVLPHGGRIAAHRDAGGQSCQVILVGWRGDEFREIWAGSALARPLHEFAVVDLNGDGRPELAVLEGDYEAPGSPARTLAVWSWNSFGFDLLARRAGTFSALRAAFSAEGTPLLLTRN